MSGVGLVHTDAAGEGDAVCEGDAASGATAAARPAPAAGVAGLLEPSTTAPTTDPVVTTDIVSAIAAKDP